MMALLACKPETSVTVTKTLAAKGATNTETTSTNTSTTSTTTNSTSPVVRQLLLTGVVSASGSVNELANGNIIISDSNATVSGVPQAGVVQLFNGTSGALISTLYGTNTADKIGSVVTILSSGNFVVNSPNWDNGAAANAGAVTFCSATTGCSGAVSAANSLVRSSANDSDQSSVLPLTNGHYVVGSPYWDNSATTNVGAVTWCSGTSGCVGIVGAGNSLIGSTAGDRIGGQLYALSNGKYVTASSFFNNGGAQAGAVTLCSGTSGCTGTVNATDSLLGSPGDQIANSGIIALPNNNYVIASSFHGGARGAVTFCSGASGCTGTLIDSTNSLVGTSLNDHVGINLVVVLSSGHYVVKSPYWRNGANTNAGAVTWCSGTSGCTGAVSAANSLVGSTSNNSVGNQDIHELPNGKYLVRSPGWDNGGTADVGAVTLCSPGAGACVGAVSAVNSLIGSTASDQVGSVSNKVLTNGHYLVVSRLWDNGGAVDAGAVTWCSASTGCTGTVTAANSLVGSTTNDGVASLVTLPNGNYVLSTPNWDNGGITDRGAVTWCSGTTGCQGVISSSNSLVGSTANDKVGRESIDALSNSTYVVASPLWDHGGLADAGAVTFCSTSTGCSGTLSSTNSLVGSTANDQLGSGGVKKLTNGNYVVSSPLWDYGGIADAGAVTWCSLTTGCVGAVSDTNSLTGSIANDQISSAGITPLSNGNYVIESPLYGNPDTPHVKVIIGSEAETGAL
jgi:hypothetical protein